jgi:hypothetical protein
MTNATAQERSLGGERTEASSGQQDKRGVPPIRAMFFFLLVTGGLGLGGYLYAEQGLQAAQSTATRQGIEITELRRQLADIQTTLAQEHLRAHMPTLSGDDVRRNSATMDGAQAQPAASDQLQDRRGRLTSGRWAGRWASTPISLVFAKSGMVVQSRAQQIWETPGVDADNSWTLEGDKVIFPVFFVEAGNDAGLGATQAVPRRVDCVFEATVDGDHLNGVSSGCGADVHLTRQ